jgi:outer membrane protein TolC
MKKRKKPNLTILFLIGFNLLTIIQLQAQTGLTIDSCYKLSRENYPLIKQLGLIEKTRQYSVENASKAWLPQLTVNAQATYQSEVTSIPFKIPHVDIPAYSKDQYKIYGELDQTIYDAGTIQNQKEQHNMDAAIQKQSTEVTLYNLKDRVNQIFFGILLLDEQLKQNDILDSTIQNNMDRLQAQVNNGVALKSGLYELQAQLLQQEQVAIQYRSSRKAYVDMLGLFINRPLNENTQLVEPLTITPIKTIKRPELTLYDYQKNIYDIQDKMLKSNYLPRLSAFFQGGYGRPGLNMLTNDFSFYYIGGIRFGWSLGSLYTLNNNRQLSQIGREQIDLQKQTFLLNTNIQMSQQNGAIVQLMELIRKDDEIVAKRSEVTADAKIRMENGTLTVHDYLGELDFENQARQNKRLHHVQLLQAMYNYQNTSGN